MRFLQSIRRKITFGYTFTAVMIVGLSVFTFLQLNYLENKIMFGEAISEFFDVTLEIRRFEKNFFLYNKKFDHDETLEYVSRASNILNINEDGFIALADPERVAGLQKDLRSYDELMRRYGVLSFQENGANALAEPVKKIELEGRIRKTGKDIVTVAEDISRTERKNLQALLDHSRRVLIISIIILSASAVVIGQVLSTLVVRPLASIEKSMEIIAEGQFESVQIDSKDQEIVSLTKAFNKMLKELDVRQRHLVQSEKLASLGTLLAGVAHELNNPLSNISSSCQILQEEIEERDTEHQKEMLSTIDDQTDRAKNIVRSLLELSRDKDFKEERIPLRHLVEETIRLLGGQVQTRTHITVEIPDDIVITADKQRIQQGFLNLIKNALEAMPEDQGTISIRAEKRRAIDDVEDEKIGIYNYMKFRGKCTLEDDTVDIEIHDTGAGIPIDNLPRIFDPFFTTKEVGKGSGLGLSIVHDIIEEHDGCIAVDSEPGKGTTFLLRLPIKETNREEPRKTADN